MSRVINKSSPKMSETNNSVSKYNFPWDDIEVGYSFGVEDNEISLSYLRSMATQKGNSLGKKFKVIDHGVTTQPRYEVGRLSYTKPEPKILTEEEKRIKDEHEIIMAERAVKGIPPWPINKELIDKPSVGTSEPVKIVEQPEIKKIDFNLD